MASISSHNFHSIQSTSSTSYLRPAIITTHFEISLSRDNTGKMSRTFTGYAEDEDRSTSAGMAHQHSLSATWAYEPALMLTPRPPSITQSNVQPRPPPFGLAPGFAVQNRHEDLLSQKLDRSVLVHAVNCQGVWGSGIALQLKKALPAAHQVYVDHCQNTPPKHLLGSCLLIPPQEADYNVYTTDGHDLYQPREWVACLFTSAGWGKGNNSKGNPGKDNPATILGHTRAALVDMRRHLESYGPSNFTEDDWKTDEYKPGQILAVRFNSGAFKVPWQDTRELIELVFAGFERGWFVCVGKSEERKKMHQNRGPRRAKTDRWVADVYNPVSILPKNQGKGPMAQAEMEGVVYGDLDPQRTGTSSPRMPPPRQLPQQPSELLPPGFDVSNHPQFPESGSPHGVTEEQQRAKRPRSPEPSTIGSATPKSVNAQPQPSTRNVGKQAVEFHPRPKKRPRKQAPTSQQLALKAFQNNARAKERAQGGK